MSRAYANFKFYSNNRYLILVSIDTYFRTESGKSWKRKPAKTERRVYDDEHYTNYISAIPFFNNFFENGAYCRAYCGYTIAGYLPAEVVTVAPFREEKKIAHFVFFDRDEMEKSAGYREHEILRDSTTWEKFNADSWRYITLYSHNGEKSATFDRVNKVWVN